MYRPDTHTENNYLNGLSDFSLLLRKGLQKGEKDRITQNRKNLMSCTICLVGWRCLFSLFNYIKMYSMCLHKDYPNI